MMRKALFLSVSFPWFSPSCHPGKPGDYRPRRPQDSAYYEDHFENFEQAYDERFEWQGVLRVAPILGPEIRACVKPER